MNHIIDKIKLIIEKIRLRFVFKKFLRDKKLVNMLKIDWEYKYNSNDMKKLGYDGVENENSDIR